MKCRWAASIIERFHRINLLSLLLSFIILLLSQTLPKHLSTYHSTNCMDVHHELKLNVRSSDEKFAWISHHMSFNEERRRRVCKFQNQGHGVGGNSAIPMWIVIWFVGTRVTCDLIRRGCRDMLFICSKPFKYVIPRRTFQDRKTHCNLWVLHCLPLLTVFLFSISILEFSPFVLNSWVCLKCDWLEPDSWFWWDFRRLSPPIVFDSNIVHNGRFGPNLKEKWSGSRARNFIHFLQSDFDFQRS
jgi:hypothetical protein